MTDLNHSCLCLPETVEMKFWSMVSVFYHHLFFHDDNNDDVISDYLNAVFFGTELMMADRHQKREIRQLEQELPRWQVLVDSITGLNHTTAVSVKMMQVSSLPFVMV